MAGPDEFSVNLRAHCGCQLCVLLHLIMRHAPHLRYHFPMEITGTIIERSKAIQFTRRYLLACLDRITDEALDFRLTPPNGQLTYSIREHLLHLADEGELLVHLSILRQDM